MLKELKWTGFERLPEVKPRLQSYAAQTEDEFGSLAGQVEAEFSVEHAGSGRPIVGLTLRLSLPGASGEEYYCAMPADELVTEGEFRKWVRFVWGNLLDRLLRGQTERINRQLFAGAEV